MAHHAGMSTYVVLFLGFFVAFCTTHPLFVPANFLLPQALLQ